MAITLAPLAPDTLHYDMYKHTDEAYMPPKDPAPPIVRTPACALNIHVNIRMEPSVVMLAK